MNFTVNWRPSTLNDLADLWTNDPDRAAITAAANAIDQLLSTNPLEQGESRAGNTRILFVEPLAILYDVDENSYRVDVWDIWRWPPISQ